MAPRRRFPRLAGAVLALLLLVLSAGCDARGAITTPDGLSYNLPTVLTVPAGEALPGTDIRYLGENDQGARMTIADESAIKRRGDSVVWEGEQLPGVDVILSQRIAWYTEREMHLVGTVRLTVDDPRPRMGRVPDDAPAQYSGPVAYSVARGETIPGSTLRYVRAAEEGAELEGVEGYPYRRGGDSILWEGSLRDGLYSQLELRVVHHNEQTLRVAGVVRLWIDS